MRAGSSAKKMADMAMVIDLLSVGAMPAVRPAVYMSLQPGDEVSMKAT